MATSPGRFSIGREVAPQDLAAGAPPDRDVPGTPVGRALAALTDAAILRRVDRGRCEFPEPMFADLLRRAQASWSNASRIASAIRGYGAGHCFVHTAPPSVVA